MRFTIFGGSGFIGTRLSAWLGARGHDVITPDRDEIALAGDLGNVIYAIGLTADFRVRPLETIDAHVCGLIARLRANTFRSWLYLSSTRVYGGLDLTEVDEDTALSVHPDNDGTFNLSKLTGEAACLALPDPSVRVARIANVFGTDMHDQAFLGMLLNDIRAGREVVIGEGPLSSKDYVSVEDVCRLLEQIALDGRRRLYNVASGVPVTHRDVAAILSAEPGVAVRFAPDGSTRTFPRISIARAANEFDYRPMRLADALPTLVAVARTKTDP